MEHSDIPCHVRGCLFVSRWAFFHDRDPEQTVCLCRAHMDELRKVNPTRAAKFVRIVQKGKTVTARSPRAA